MGPIDQGGRVGDLLISGFIALDSGEADPVGAILQVWKFDDAILRADRMLELSADPANRGVPLPACALIYLVASLEQALDTMLGHYLELRTRTLRERMKAAPAALSNGQMELNERCEHVRQIHWAISKRNDLMHVGGSAVEIGATRSSDPVEVRVVDFQDGVDPAFITKLNALLAGVSRDQMRQMQSDDWDEVSGLKVVEARIAIADYVGEMAQWSMTHEYVGSCFRRAAPPR